MKYSVRVWMKYLLRGILWGCTFFVLFCLFAYYLWGKEFLFSMLEAYPKHALGTMFVGIGYGTTPIVYGWERPSLLTKVGIHFFVGTGIFFGVAFYLAWLPRQLNRYLALEIAVACLSFAILWSIFYLFSCKEAKAINDRLKELENN